MRAGVTRQAAGQLLKEIERCRYVELRAAPDDARATTVHFTARGRRLLATVFELVEEIERDFAAVLEPGAYDALREDLLRIADRIDPGGALGAGDARERDAPAVKDLTRCTDSSWGADARQFASSPWHCF